MPPATLHLGLDTLCFLLEIFFLGSLWSPVTPLKQQFCFFLRLVARRPGDLVCFQEILV